MEAVSDIEGFAVREDHDGREFCPLPHLLRVLLYDASIHGLAGLHLVVEDDVGQGEHLGASVDCLDLILRFRAVGRRSACVLLGAWSWSSNGNGVAILLLLRAGRLDHRPGSLLLDLLRVLLREHTVEVETQCRCHLSDGSGRGEAGGGDRRLLIRGRADS